MTNSPINTNRRARVSKNSRGASVRVNEKKKQKKRFFPGKILLAIVSLGAVYLLLINSHSLYEKVNTQKIDHVVIEGNMDYVSENEVKRAVFRFINKNMVTINLTEIKLELEKNPWIKSVDISREWPGTLIVNVSEELAIARWGRDQLLNQEGEIFSPNTVLNQTHLAYLSGPEGSEQEVMEQYQQFNQVLYPLSFRIARLDVNSRKAWELELENGIKIKLGNTEKMERIRRFIDSVDILFGENPVDIETIDLRYNNGIAVSHKQKLADDVVSL